jgi:predicted RNA binding protein YcfA (HicA-like mRNA interferase family)
MPRLPVVPSSRVIKALTRVGFSIDRQRGSHIVLYRQSDRRTVVVPRRDELPRGTLRVILNEAGLTVDEFMELL